MKTLAELIKARIPIDPDDGTAVVRYASDDSGSGYAVWGNPDDVVSDIVGAVQEWLRALSRDDQVPVNRDLRDEYEFLIREANKFLIHEAGRGLDDD